VPKFSANLSFLYQEAPLLDRISKAAADGFAAVEYVSPYEHDAAAIAEKLAETGVQQALFNLPAGDWAAGERGIACLPDRIQEFRQGVDLAIEYAAELRCPLVNCLAGIAPDGVDVDVLDQVMAENLRYAAPRLADAGIALVFEPINQRDMPGYHLSTSLHAERMLALANVDNLKIQFDFYHMQVTEGDIANSFARLLPKIGHVQIADNPGRHEPGTGEINYSYVLKLLDQLGYDGWVGCEYKPKTTTSAGLGWMSPYRT
jgi:hydroxypyruvate isomerase